MTNSPIIETAKSLIDIKSCQSAEIQFAPGDSPSHSSSNSSASPVQDYMKQQYDSCLSGSSNESPRISPVNYSKRLRAKISITKIHNQFPPKGNAL